MKDYPICMTARLNAECQVDDVSITNVVEKLDIELLLQRAQQGILDLHSYQRPMQSDYNGSGSSPEQVEKSTRALIHEPDNPLNHVFGVDRETAAKAQNELLSLAAQSSVTKEVKPAPNEPSKNDSGEGDHGKVEPPSDNS